MSNEWETTEDDVRTVLSRHGLILSDERVKELCDGLDHDEIADNVLCYTSMTNQVSSMLSDIETHLIVAGVVVGPKKFVMLEMMEPETDIHYPDSN